MTRLELHSVRRSPFCRSCALEHKIGYRLYHHDSSVNRVSTSSTFHLETLESTYDWFGSSDFIHIPASSVRAKLCILTINPAITAAWIKLFASFMLRSCVDLDGIQERRMRRKD